MENNQNQDPEFQVNALKPLKPLAPTTHSSNHTASNTTPLKDLNQTQICFDFTKNQCSRGAACKFSHDIQHIIQVNSQEKGICFDFLKGVCNRGLLCRFSHDIGSLQIPPVQQLNPGSIPRATMAPICYDFVKNQCTRGDTCKYSHDYSSIIYGPRQGGKNPSVICVDFTRGRCFRGSTCRYAHLVDPLNTTVTAQLQLQQQQQQLMQQQRQLGQYSQSLNTMNTMHQSMPIMIPSHQSNIVNTTTTTNHSAQIDADARYAAILLELQRLNMNNNTQQSAVEAPLPSSIPQQQHHHNHLLDQYAIQQQSSAPKMQPSITPMVQFTHPLLAKVKTTDVASTTTATTTTNNHNADNHTAESPTIRASWGGNTDNDTNIAFTAAINAFQQSAENNVSSNGGGGGFLSSGTSPVLGLHSSLQQYDVLKSIWSNPK